MTKYAWLTLIKISLIVGFLTSCASPTGPAPVSSIANVSKKYDRPIINGNRYIVRRGDTLFSIAFAAGLSHKLLAVNNNIKKPYTIYPGMSLTLSKNTPSIKVVKKSAVSKKWQKKLDSQKKDTYSKPVIKPKRSTKKVVKKSNRVSLNGGKAKKIAKWIWPAKGRVVSVYSATSQGNKGIDIAGLKGSNIVASAAGKVVYAGSALKGYGNLIIIKHNDDFLSAYAHNKTLFVKDKQQIRQGQLIAKMGKTESKTVQLHFEIRFRGKSVNPANYLPKR